jgi:hypothetical protein
MYAANLSKAKHLELQFVIKTRYEIGTKFLINPRRFEPNRNECEKKPIQKKVINA